jgi:MFS family permease
MHHENESQRLFTPELYAVLFVCSIAFYSGELLNPILSLYLSSVGMSATTIGLMFSIMMVGIAISEIFWGWVVDRVDLRIAIFVGTVLLGLAILGLSLVQSVMFIGVVLFFYGFCRSPIFIVSRWYMGVYAPKNRKAFAMALVGAVIGIVQSIGGFTSGFITETHSYTFTFRLAAGLALTAGILMVIIGRRLNFQKHKHTPHAEIESNKPKVSPNVKLITFSLGTIGVLYFIAFGVFGTYLPLFAKEVIGASTSQVGTMFGVRGLLSTIMMIPLGRFIDKKDKWIFLPIGLSIVAIAMAGIALSGSYTWLVASVLLFAVGSAIYGPTATALLSQNVPVFWTGTAMGIFGFMEDIGWMIGPSVGGLLWVSISKPSAFWFAGLIALLAIPVVYFAKNHIALKTQPGISAEKNPMVEIHAE